MPEPRPNVVFLFADDQRFDTIRELGCEAIQTPNLDGLVRRGTAFTHAHIPCGTSGAICMPSRAMVLTGRTLFHIQGAGQAIPPEHTTMGEAFRAAGYRTFGTGKWHNGRESYHRSFADGDEIFFGGMADHWNVPAYHYDPTGKYDSRRPWVPDAHRSNEVHYRDCDHIQVGRHSSEIIADAAVRFVREQDAEHPFFLYVPFLAPHDPRTMPQKYLDMYDPDEVELPPNFMGGHPFDMGNLHGRDESLAGFPRTPRETRRHIAEYYAMITHLDAEVGRVLAALDERGLTENTVIVYAGDNGLALGQHGLFGKQNCYEHSVRVPLIFAGPAVPEGARTDAYAYLLDIFATLCEMTGVDTPDSVEGTSLLPAMDDPDVQVRHDLYFAFVGMHRAVKDERFKLIEYCVGGRHNMTQLFDLDEDPWESRNLATDPAHAGKLAELRERMCRFRDEWDDRRTEWGQKFWSVYEGGAAERG